MEIFLLLNMLFKTKRLKCELDHSFKKERYNFNTFLNNLNFLKDYKKTTYKSW